MIGSETKSLSGSEFCFGVEALDNTAGKLPLGPKPVKQQRSMPLKHSCNPLHGRYFRTHGFFAPVVQEPVGPANSETRKIRWIEALGVCPTYGNRSEKVGNRGHFFANSRRILEYSTRICGKQAPIYRFCSRFVTA